MPRRPATVTQADVARMLRAARDAGYPNVRVEFDGSRVVLRAGQVIDNQAADDRDDVAEPKRLVVL